MPALILDTKERQALRASAHALRPVVLVGDRGLTDSVRKEIDASLKAHGLIKVRMAGEDRETRDAWLTELCDELSCAPVSHLGKILILYRPLPESPSEAGRARNRNNTRQTKKQAAAKSDRRG